MNAYIETAISLILVFFLFSTIAYVIQELIAVNLQYRGRMLWRSLANLLDNFSIEKRNIAVNSTTQQKAPGTKAFYDHPQIRSLLKNTDRLPAYIPAANFALALMDEVAKKAPTVTAGNLFANVQSGLTQFVNAKGDIYGVLKNLVESSKDIKELQQKIESWYNEYMDRVTGWYKAHTVVTLRWIALGVTLFFNINVIRLAKEVFTNSDLRGTLVSVAEKVADHPENVSLYYTKNFDNEVAAIEAKYKVADTASESEKKAAAEKAADEKLKAADLYTQKRLAAIDSLSGKLTTTALPLGWKKSVQYSLLGYEMQIVPWDIAWLLLGWAIAAGCLSMGAPFWFDLLVKVINIRRAGIKPTAGNTKRQ